MKVVWSDRALRSLATFPFSGRLVERYKRPGIRELIESPYRIVYRVTGQQVQVIDVFHSAQLPPWER